MPDLLKDLEAASDANMFARPCQVCQALPQMEPEAAQTVHLSILRRTIGERTIAEILTRNGYPTGRRAVIRHREEGHPA